MIVMMYRLSGLGSERDLCSHQCACSLTMSLTALLAAVVMKGRAQAVPFRPAARYQAQRL